MVVLFKEGRLLDFSFLPQETAADGTKGVFEVSPVTELGEKDSVALAAGMAGELANLGKYDSQRVVHDRQQVERLVGKALEDFLPDAQRIIEQNLRFFSLLNTEVVCGELLRGPILPANRAAKGSCLSLLERTW
jgi:hypothetical protein